MKKSKKSKTETRAVTRPVKTDTLLLTRLRTRRTREL